MVKHILAIGFVLLYCFVIGQKLIMNPVPFFDWDESIYVQTGKEMVQNGSLVPLWQGEPWLEKPPLAVLAFGLVHVLPFDPEISTRMLALTLSGVALLMVYAWFYKVTKATSIALLGIVLLAFNPIFLQRAHVVNTDSLLLIGWVGYVLWYKNIWVGLAFLGIAVMSKSLIGLLPLFVIMGAHAGALVLPHLFRFTANESKTVLKNGMFQLSVLSLWYVVMYIIYKELFLQVHFYDHMVRRVTASIESHFGQRTFYLDVLIQQIGLTQTILAFLVTAILLVLYYTKLLNVKQILFSLVFLPWFVVLNLTKTKIEWYLYPVIPQFILLFVYPLVLIKSFPVALRVIVAGVIAYTLYVNVVSEPVGEIYYSQETNYTRLAKNAGAQCTELNVLLDPTARQTFQTLEDLGLLISTSKIYGNRPSIVYYSGIPVQYLYSVEDINSVNADECLLLELNDYETLGDDLVVSILTEDENALIGIVGR